MNLVGLAWNDAHHRPFSCTRSTQIRTAPVMAPMMPQVVPTTSTVAAGGNDVDQEGTYYSPQSGQSYPEQPRHQTWRSPACVLLFIHHAHDPGSPTHCR